MTNKQPITKQINAKQPSTKQPSTISDMIHNVLLNDQVEKAGYILSQLEPFYSCCVAGGATRYWYGFGSEVEFANYLLELERIKVSVPEMLDEGQKMYDSGGLRKLPQGVIL